MSLKIRALSLVLAVLAGGLCAQEAPRLNEAHLPLKDYLALVEKAEAAERDRERQAALREKPVSEVAAQRTTVVVGEKEAEVAAEIEVLVQGRPQAPVLLPFAGFVAEVAVEPAGAAVSAANVGGLLLVAPNAGRYTVKARGRAPLQNRGGISRFDFAPVLAPVATTEVDLPADLAWSAPGSVVVEDREGEPAGRRKVRLAVRRGEAQVLEVRRRIEGGEAEKLLAQSVVLTIVQLQPDGVRRHDVVLYEVARGGLASFTVDLPPGLAVETAGTDEGDVVPVVESRRLTVHRKSQLTGTGYLVLTSTPQAAALPLASVVPGPEVRARYVAVSSSVAADIRPQPDAAWARVDLDDLPPFLREALASLDLSAAWRLVGPGTPETALAVSLLPAAPGLPALVRRRETTTLLTVDGTLLHRELLTLEPSSGPGTALDLTLPAAATLWSAQVDGEPVRPLERSDGRISVPLGFGEGGKSVVEVVAVLERAIPAGRSQLALDLAQVAVPVLEHRWRLLLPEGPRYRFRAGDLRPAPGGLSVLTTGFEESIVVTSPRPRRDRSWGLARPKRKPATPPADEAPAAYFDFNSFEELQNSLVGGVKPLPVTIPEAGKVLLLTGVLPPPKVTAALEVKAKR